MQCGRAGGFNKVLSFCTPTGDGADVTVGGAVGPRAAGYDATLANEVTTRLLPTISTSTGSYASRVDSQI